MTHVHKKRLLKLADFLDKLPNKKFNYGFWLSDSGCGTVGCSLGWACTMDAFKRLGAGIIDDVPGFTRPSGQKNAYGIALHLFGVSDEEFMFLFKHPEGTRATSKQAARHIRKFVKTGRMNFHVFG